MNHGRLNMLHVFTFPMKRIVASWACQLVTTLLRPMFTWTCFVLWPSIPLSVLSPSHASQEEKKTIFCWGHVCQEESTGQVGPTAQNQNQYLNPLHPISPNCYPHTVTWLWVQPNTTMPTPPLIAHILPPINQLTPNIVSLTHTLPATPHLHLHSKHTSITLATPRPIAMGLTGHSNK